MNPGSSIGGTVTGVINVAGTFQAVVGGTSTIGRLTITVNSTSQIDGTLTFTSGTGTPTLKGNVTLSATGSINFTTAAQTVVMQANLIMNPGSSIDGSVTGVITVAGTFTGVAGGTVTLGRLTITVTGATAVNGTLLFSTVTGVKTFTGDVTLAAAAKISFSAAQTVAMGGNLNATAGCTIGGGGAVGIINVAGTFNVPNAGTTTLGGVTLNEVGNLILSGTGVLDASAANNTLGVGGNWTSTSTGNANDPFIEGTSTITFNGTVGTQSVSTVKAGGETFYNITISNTSATSPGVQFMQGQVLVGSLFYTTTATVGITGNLTMNSGSSMDGSATGVLNITGSFIDFVGGTETIGRVAPTFPLATLINGTLTFSNLNGTATFSNNLTLTGTGSLYFTGTKTVSVGGNLLMNSGSSIDGTATGIVNVTGTFADVVGGTETIGRGTINVTSTSLISGTLTFSNASGIATFTGNVTLPATGAIFFTGIKIVAMSGNLMMNPGSSIDGTVTGIITVGGTFSAVIGGTETLGRLTITVASTSQIDGTLRFTNGNGTPTFTDNVTLSATGAIYFTAGQTVGITNNLIMNPGSSIDGTVVGTVNVGGTFNAVVGGTESIGFCTVAVTSTSQIDGTLAITNANGSKTLIGNVTMSNGSAISFTAAETLAMSGSLTISGTASIGGTLTGFVTVGGNLNIAGTSVLDCSSSGSPSLSVAGNWNITSTAADPFREGTSAVIFNGSSGTQIVSTPLAQETFYTLTVNNTSVTNPGVRTSVPLLVTSNYNHTAGILDLNSKALTVNSTRPFLAGASFITCALSGGSIITGVAGSTISFTDVNNDSLYVNFTGTKVGNSTFSIPLTINTGKINIQSLELYGVGTFIKYLPSDDASSLGNNKYHNDVTFTALNAASRWRTSTGGTAKADTFLGKTTFNAFANGGANNNFIIGANSVGNYYVDTVKITSTTVGGLYIGRSNGGSGAGSSHTFMGHVEVTVTLTGNVSFADGGAGDPSSVIFNKSLRLNSSASSTGDIYVGEANAFSTVTMSNTGQLIDGTINGATNVYFYNVTQNGALGQSTINAGVTNSNITVGASGSPCTWNGSITLSAPNINLAYSTFNGTSNIFTMNGLTSNQNCTGGNTFGAGGTSTFINNGTVYWRLANTAADDYNGDVAYKRASTGQLSPAYNANCTYAGNISIQAASDSVDFASGAGGRVIFDGASSASFTNSGTKGTSIKNITMNKTAGNFTLNNSIGMPTGGNLALTSGKIITSSTGLLFLMDETCSAPALTSSATSYIDGPMRYDVSASGTTQTLNFPVGKSSDCRPVVLTVRHSAATSFSYTGELFNAPATLLAWTLPATVDTVSGVHYWNIDRTVTSSGAAASNTSLSFSAGAFPLVQLYFDVNDAVYQGSNLTICKNTNGAPTTWIDIGATCALGNFATPQAGSITSTTSGTPFNSFSTFTLGSKLTGWNSLPVDLLSFTAVKRDNQVDIKWSTATETNNKYFTIERSQDGITFKEIESVNTKALNGNSLVKLNYNTVDVNPLAGTSYYRLKQTDKNGKFKYYSIVSVEFAKDKAITFSIYPNPNSGEFTVDFSGIENNHEVQITIYDELGKSVYVTSVYSDSINSNKFLISPDKKLAAGKYFCSLVLEGIKHTVVLIIN